MMIIEIEHPHSYMTDSDGRVCLKFGDWAVAEHSVPDYVESVEYVNGPASHDVEISEDYRDNS